jgi:hypothetical protein
MNAVIASVKSLPIGTTVVVAGRSWTRDSIGLWTNIDSDTCKVHGFQGHSVVWMELDRIAAAGVFVPGTDY